MKKNYKITFLVFLFYSIFCNSQINPEEIIIKTDLNKNTKTVKLKNKISPSLDSLNFTELFDKMKELQSPKDSTTIKKMLIGEWKFKNTKTFDGENRNIKIPLKYIFLKNNIFKSIETKDTISGVWSIVKTDVGNLKINYNKPQTLIKDKKYLKTLSKEDLKRITYNSNILIIYKIDKDHVVFLKYNQLGNSDVVEDQKYRLLLITYKKVTNSNSKN